MYIHIQYRASCDWREGNTKFSGSDDHMYQVEKWIQGNFFISAFSGRLIPLLFLHLS